MVFLWASCLCCHPYCHLCQPSQLSTPLWLWGSGMCVCVCACIQIYPPELELKKTTESHDSCSYLDLNINVLNGKFCTDLYDKRDAFNFSIVNFPHMDSNIPSKPAYGVVISRYLRICCNYQDFVYRSKLLTIRLLRQGYVYQKLCSTYKTFVHRYPRTLQKYGRCLKNIITECIAIATV